jgi:hypothetical protein
MNLARIVITSLRQHIFSSALAVVSISLGVALLLAVTSLREQAHRQFTQVGLGVDAVLGPKGSPMQIALNALYHLEEMPGRMCHGPTTRRSRPIPWSSPTASPSSPATPMRATGSTRSKSRFLTDFEYLPGHRFSVARRRWRLRPPLLPARTRRSPAPRSRALSGLQLGQTFNPTCGVTAGDPGPCQRSHRLRRHPRPHRHPARPRHLHPAGDLLHPRGPWRLGRRAWSRTSTTARSAAPTSSSSASAATPTIPGVHGTAVRHQPIDPRPSWSCPPRSCPGSSSSSAGSTRCCGRWA